MSCGARFSLLFIIYYTRYTEISIGIFAQKTNVYFSPVFRRSTMKVPTFSNFPLHFKLLKYLKNACFYWKIQCPHKAFFIEKIFDMLYNNSTT